MGQSSHIRFGVVAAALAGLLGACDGGAPAEGDANSRLAGDAGASGAAGGPTDGATTTRRICDGSAGLTLGHRYDTGQRSYGDVGRVQEGGGFDALYVSGGCRYWVLSILSESPWRAARTGVLSSDQAEALAAAMKYDTLPSWYGVHGTTAAGGDRRVVFDGQGSVVCLADCEEAALPEMAQLRQGAHGWAVSLWGAGADLDGHMRLAVVAPLAASGPVLPLKLSRPLADLAGLGGASPWVTTVTDPVDLKSLRDLRAVVTSEGWGSAPAFSVSDREGESYLVSFRDSVPAEDDAGIVAEPGK